MENFKGDNNLRGDHSIDSLESGTADILKNCNVEAAPPSVNRPIPVPSVFVEERGEIHNLQVGDKRVNMLFSRKGVMRSGDIHENTQHDFVFEGKVEVWKLTKEGTQKTVHSAKEYIQIEPYVPHIFHFLEDTVMAEWWEPQGFYAWFYAPYRNLVQKSFRLTKVGKLRLLKEVDENSKNCEGTTTSSETRHRDLFLSLAGIAVGTTVGFFLGALIT